MIIENLQIVLAKLSLVLISLAMATSTMTIDNSKVAINGAGLEKEAVMSGGTEKSLNLATEAILGQKQANRGDNQKIWEGYPLLKQICSCESAFAHPFNEPRQFENGEPLWGYDPKIKGARTTDVGSCQISMKYHKTATEKLGLDVINSFEDNVKYAKILFDKNGTKDWKASENCWNRK